MKFMRIALDPTQAGRVLGWKPNTELTQGIKRTVAWLHGILDPPRYTLPGLRASMRSNTTPPPSPPPPPPLPPFPPSLPPRSPAPFPSHLPLVAEPGSPRPIACCKAGIEPSVGAGLIAIAVR